MWLSIGALLALAPTTNAQTQQMALSIDDIKVVGSPTFLEKGLLEPETDRAEYQVSLAVELPPLSFCLSSIQILYTVRPENGWISTMVNPASETFTYASSSTGLPTTGPAGEAVHGFKTMLTMTASRDAPAFWPGKVVLTAQARATATPQSGCNLADSAVLTIPFTLVANYVPRMVYEVANGAIPVNAGQPFQVPIRMTNLGNGATQVSSTVLEWGPDGCFDRLVPPAMQVVSSLSQDPQSGNSVDAMLRGVASRAGFCSFKMKFEAGSVVAKTVDAEQQVDEVAFTLTVEDQGGSLSDLDHDLPAPGILESALMFGLVAIAASLGRRR